MENKYILLRSVTWFVCIYHFLLGVVLNCPVPWIEWTASHLLGATKMPDPSALFLARMLGGYLMAFGLIAGLAAWDPIKNRSNLSVVVILTMFRSLQRVLQADDLEQTLGITPRSNWTMIVVPLAFAAILLYFRYRIYVDMKAGFRTTADASSIKSS